MHSLPYITFAACNFRVPATMPGFSADLFCVCLCVGHSSLCPWVCVCVFISCCGEWICESAACQKLLSFQFWNSYRKNKNDDNNNIASVLSFANTSIIVCLTVGYVCLLWLKLALNIFRAHQREQIKAHSIIGAMQTRRNTEKNNNNKRKENILYNKQKNYIICSAYVGFVRFNRS